MQSKLNKIVTNKALSQKLWVLGVRVDSIFYWFEKKGEWRIEFYQNLALPDKNLRPAPTSSELGEILLRVPKDIEVDDECDKLIDAVNTMKNEANNRARLIIYLIEQGLVSPKCLSI